eukprot:UN03087
MKATADLETYLLPVEQLKMMVKRMSNQDRILAAICWGIFTMMLMTIILSVRADNYNNLPIQIQNEPIVAPQVIIQTQQQQQQQQQQEKQQQQQQQATPVVTPDTPSSTIPVATDAVPAGDDSIEDEVDTAQPTTNDNAIDNNNDDEQQQQQSDQDIPASTDIETPTVPVAEDAAEDVVNDVAEAVPVAKDTLKQKTHPVFNWPSDQ